MPGVQRMTISSIPAAKEKEGADSTSASLFAMLPVITCTLCLTHNCNLRCRYCYAGPKYAHAMSRETARKAMDIVISEALRTGCCADLSFFGGEPLLEWDLLQWCHGYMKEKGASLSLPPRFSVTTNGTLLTAERLEWLSAEDFLIGLSLDGSPRMHNLNRCYAGGRGSHADILPALQWIGEHPKTRSEIICVVTPSNVHLLSEGVAWMAAHYKGRIGLNIDYWSDWTDGMFGVLSREYGKAASLVLESYRAGTPILLENLDEKITTHLRQDGDCDHCRIGEREIAVSVDGNFFPCSRLVGQGDDPELCFGNVREGINRAKQLAIIATRGNATPACRLCSLRSRCRNTCGCTNRAASGKINEVSPFLCSSEKLAIHTADEMAETLYHERNPAFMKRFYGRG